jgi:chromosome segregation ATPase
MNWKVLKMMDNYEKMKMKTLEKQVWEFGYIQNGYKHQVRTLEEKLHALKVDREEAEKRLEEQFDELEKVREDLRIALNVAERRADMIRDLVRENRTIRKQLQEPKPEITEDVIAEVTRVLKKHIEPVQVATAEYQGWNF